MTFPFAVPKLYTVARIDDDVTLAGVHDTRALAEQHIQTLAPNFTYRVDTIVPPKGIPVQTFKAQVEAMLRGAQGGQSKHAES